MYIEKNDEDIINPRVFGLKRYKYKHINVKIH